jgi:hypothetical protein
VRLPYDWVRNYGNSEKPNFQIIQDRMPKSSLNQSSAVARLHRAVAAGSGSMHRSTTANIKPPTFGNKLFALYQGTTLVVP